MSNKKAGTAVKLYLCSVCAKAKPASLMAMDYGIPVSGGYYSHICLECLSRSRGAVKVKNPVNL